MEQEEIISKTENEQSTEKKGLESKNEIRRPPQKETRTNRRYKQDWREDFYET